MVSSYGKPDYTFAALIISLAVIGLIILSSASSVNSFERYGDSNEIVKKQLLVFLIGLVLFIFAATHDYHSLKRMTFIAFLVSVVLLFVVFIPGIGVELLGAKRWISIGGVFFQPSELVKLTFLAYLASWLDRRGGDAHEFTYGFLPFLATLGALALILIFQPDIGTMIVIAAASLVVYVVSGARIRYISAAVLGGVLLLAFIVKIAPYRAARLTTFLNPELDPQGIGYHINQALLAIGSGGIFGRGLGHSIQKFRYLPEAAGDSIFAVMAEELGFLLLLGFIILVGVLIVRGFRISRHAPDPFGRYLAAGIISWFAIQTIINLGALTGLLPLTGIPLPFISHGGTSLIVLFVAAGILVNISKAAKSH